MLGSRRLLIRELLILWQRQVDVWNGYDRLLWPQDLLKRGDSDNRRLYFDFHFLFGLEFLIQMPLAHVQVEF